MWSCDFDKTCRIEWMKLFIVLCFTIRLIFQYWWRILISSYQLASPWNNCWKCLSTRSRLNENYVLIFVAIEWKLLSLELQQKISAKSGNATNYNVEWNNRLALRMQRKNYAKCIAWQPIDERQIILCELWEWLMNLLGGKADVCSWCSEVKLKSFIISFLLTLLGLEFREKMWSGFVSISH